MRTMQESNADRRIICCVQFSFLFPYLKDAFNRDNRYDGCDAAVLHGLHAGDILDSRLSNGFMLAVCLRQFILYYSVTIYSA